MSATIDFYFDFSSPYSYIAAERIDALAARYGFAVAWTPILLGVVFRETGGVPLTELHPWKADYYREDFARSARLHGLPYRHPSRFPQPTQAAARALVWLQRNQPSLAHPFALEVFRALFVRDADLTAPQTLAAIARSLGIDDDALLAATGAPEMKAALAANCEAATRLRVCGAPTFVVDGERFWGQDRLPHLEQRLREKAGGKGVRALVDEANARVRTLTVDEALALHGAPDVVFIDLRDPRELDRDGVIPDAVHAPRGMLEFWVDPASPYHKPVFAQDKHYVLFCAGGLRSALAAAAMQDMGFLRDVSHMAGGFSAWKKQGAPTTEKPRRA